MFEWLKNKLFGADRVVFYNDPTVEIITLSQKPKKITPKITVRKKPAVKKPAVKKKPPVVKVKK